MATVIGVKKVLSTWTNRIVPFKVHGTFPNELINYFKKYWNIQNRLTNSFTEQLN